MSKKAKYLLFTVFKLLEYLPLITNDLLNRFIVNPIISGMILLGVSDKTISDFSVVTLLFPKPPLWLIFFFVALVPSLLVSFTAKTLRAVINYYFFAFVIDLLIAVFVLAPYFLGLNPDLIGGMVTYGVVILFGILLSARTVGLLFSFFVIKIFKINSKPTLAS